MRRAVMRLQRAHFDTSATMSIGFMNSDGLCYARERFDRAALFIGADEHRSSLDAIALASAIERQLPIAAPPRRPRRRCSFDWPHSWPRRRCFFERSLAMSYLLAAPHYGRR